MSDDHVRVQRRLSMVQRQMLFGGDDMILCHNCVFRRQQTCSDACMRLYWDRGDCVDYHPIEDGMVGGVKG